jgi:hypothetical protein
LPGYYAWSLLKLDILLVITLTSALLSVSLFNQITVPASFRTKYTKYDRTVQIHHIGILSVITLGVFVTICTTTAMLTLGHKLPFPPTDTFASLAAISITTLAFAAYVQITTIQHRRSRTDSAGTPPVLFEGRVPIWFYLVLLTVCLPQLAIWTTRSGNTIYYHPIDLLIYDAQSAHAKYVSHASASKDIGQAVNSYRARYKRYPPPAFDHWYRYATERSSVILDDFDTIHNDLLPFHALPPEKIRRRTQRLLKNPWHNATGISIRDGKAAISSHVNDDHRWMMNGIVDLISKFSEWLPDMDMAFNIHDESRIAVHWDDLDSMRKAVDSSEAGSRPSNEFSSGRAAQWELLPDLAPDTQIMTDLSWEPIFHSHGAAHCPPGSAARARRQWDRSRLCTSCTEPHSLGPFLANWTNASDVCHQPDLAELHGFYYSPSTFKTIHELLPLFSQSKAPGFNDILYPSVWNWLDKAKYTPSDEYPDVPFSNKNKTLFWRGASSEGISPDRGQWKGMSRQRFLHILNDVNVAGASQPLLLPQAPAEEAENRQPGRKRHYTYTDVPVSTLTSLMYTDVHFVGRFVRCWDIDCPQQEAEFGLAERTNFQEHWQYKYLLDVDGAGFSGRFLPFMQSRSLPFKASLFKEWWDDRLTAWQHFVPLDLRAHGVWATLAYFVGLEGEIDGKHVKLEPHISEGKRIATNGREWAQKVLRKEDMEIYFFRLLLEWGRLTDDDRDLIGFSEGDIR